VVLGGDSCKGQPCGSPCAFDPCPTPGCGADLVPGACDWGGACVMGMPMCSPPPKPPCSGKTCGTPCLSSMVGHPRDFFCNAEERCEPGPPMCQPPDPCHGLQCGAPCGPGCDPLLDGGCPPPSMFCDMLLHCVKGPPMGPPMCP
jgi:hypothetical protein